VSFVRRVSALSVFFFIPLVVGEALAGTSPAVNHEVRVRLDPASRALHVEDQFPVEAEGAIVFGLAPWLTLVEAKVNGKAAEAQRTGRLVRIPQAANGRYQVELVLQGVVPALPALDKRVASTGAVADAQGSFLPGYSDWMADTGEDWIGYRLTVEVPAPYRAVATGQLVEERIDQATYRASFAADHPAERPSIFAGPYEIRERLEQDLRIRTYFHRELADLAGDYLEVSVDYIRRYAELIGPYPYADFHIVSAPLPVGLGFPNLTYIGRRVLPLPFMRGRSLAHEILHNWWGNGVAVDYARGNWAEGLTTYMADYALAMERSGEAAREMRLSWLRNFAALPAERDLPVERFIAKRHDAAQVVGYDKVAFIFDMLHREMGSAAFGAGVRRFWRERRFQVGAWSDLQNAFEHAAGKSLAWFFDQWLRRQGAPRIELIEAGRRGDARDYHVSVTLRQEPPAYRVRLPIVVETSAGPLRREVLLEEPEQEFQIAVEHKPLSVHIDPDFGMFRRLLNGESSPIFREVTLSDRTQLILATQDIDMTRTARQLARRLLQREPRVYRGDPQQDLSGVPILVIGAGQDVADLHELMGSKQANGIAELGTARAWVERRPGRAPWLFVAADDARSLEAIARPLPHYRNQSYVVFNGSKITRKGLWPVVASPLSHRFGG
jgi:hypothetical protein